MLSRRYSTPSSRWKSVASKRMRMILRVHPIIHSAKNRSLKSRDLTRTSPHPPSHCLQPSEQSPACKYKAFSTKLTLRSTISSWHWCTAPYSIPSDHPPLLHRQPFLPSNANLNACPVPLDSVQEKDSILHRICCRFHCSFSSYCLFLSQKYA